MCFHIWATFDYFYFQNPLTQTLQTWTSLSLRDHSI